MKKILVIDDADFILDTTATILKFEGYQVYVADNGRIGFDIAKKHTPNLILCDISMQEVDGYQLLELIRNDSNLNRTPFVFLTAFADKSNIRLGMEKGADDYLIKPFSRDELIASINAQLKKHDIVEKQLEEKVTNLGKSIISILPHEFRTVLNQISGSAKYMNINYQTIHPADILEFTNDILDSSSRLLKITENYLIYSRLELFSHSSTKKKMLREFKTDEPLAVIKDISQIIAKNVNRLDDLVINDNINNIYVEISTESFHKIIHELVENAFTFSTIGTEVKIDLQIIDDEFIEIQIIDSGRGMSEEHLSSVGAMIQFERDVFEQQGIGLGLIIARKIIKLHDGHFEIKSNIGNGTIVKFTLPYKLIN